MTYQIRNDDRIGLIHPSADAHTLGMSSLAGLLSDCGYPAFIARGDVCQECGEAARAGSLTGHDTWIHSNGITVLGFSYRLDPADALRIFSAWYALLRERLFLASEGGPVRAVYFAGLPLACSLVRERFPEVAAVFQGDETQAETLALLGIDQSRIPESLFALSGYDDGRLSFGRELIAKGAYRDIKKEERVYSGFGTKDDTLEKRVSAARTAKQGPLMRAHVGPYTGNPGEDFKVFRSWTKELAAGGLLDVLSIGTSQLTQSHFFADRTDLPDGGGISIRSEADYETVWNDARPMLVRTYAGTRDIPRLAAMHEKSLHIAWHALSFWWFCALDGRGPYGLAENLAQHFDTMRFAAASGKPLEPNVPHHFAFRGGDDVTYIVSGFLAAKAAKKAGIRTLVLQIMLNTPKYTSGFGDLAKARALRAMVRTLEDRNFAVLLQTRGGLDYFSPDLDKAKVQLAAVSALMTDIDGPEKEGPAIVHVVSYSEAVRLADPEVINESIQITRESMTSYRKLRSLGQVEDINKNGLLRNRTEELLADARFVVDTIEKLIPRPYTPEGFHAIFKAGFLPVPWLWECRAQYPDAVKWETKLSGGGISVVDSLGKPIPTAERMEMIRESLKGKKHGTN